MERMNSTEPININYLQRITASIDIPEGTRYSWKPTVLNSRPRYIIIGFKDATPEFKEVNSKFIQTTTEGVTCNVRQLIINKNSIKHNLLSNESIIF